MRLFGKRTQPEKGEQSLQVEWLPYGSSTTTAVRELMEAQDGRFELYAGATLALHQDTKAFLAVDMAKTDDNAEAIGQIGLDRIRQHRFGTHAERLNSTMKIMMNIENRNFDILEKEKINYHAGSPSAPDTIAAHISIFASRTWTITIMSKLEDFRFLELSRDTLWMYLSIVPLDVILDRAEMFTGYYYDGISCSCMNADFWPKPI